MPEKPHSDPVSNDEPPQIDTPVIDMQDLEHDAGPGTRVSNHGVRVEPTIDSASLRDFAKNDEEALAAIEKLDRALREQRPGDPAMTKRK